MDREARKAVMREEFETFMSLGGNSTRQVAARAASEVSEELSGARPGIQRLIGILRRDLDAVREERTRLYDLRWCVELALRERETSAKEAERRVIEVLREAVTRVKPASINVTFNVSNVEKVDHRIAEATKQLRVRIQSELDPELVLPLISEGSVDCGDGITAVLTKEK